MFKRGGNNDIYEDELFGPSDIRTGIDLNTDKEALAELEDPLLREHIEEARLNLQQFQYEQTLLKNIDELKSERLKMKMELSQMNINLHNCSMRSLQTSDNLYTIINSIQKFRSGQLPYGFPPLVSEPKVVYDHIINKLNEIYKDVDECANNIKKYNNDFIVTRRRCENTTDGLIAHFD